MDILQYLAKEGDKLSPREVFYYNLLLDYRCIQDTEEICPKCHGFGYATYPSTAVWGGGVGGQQITASVCDKCWGSGNILNKWPSWKTMLNQEAKDKVIARQQEAIANLYKRMDVICEKLQKYDPCAYCKQRTLDGDAKACYDKCQRKGKHKEDNYDVQQV